MPFNIIIIYLINYKIFEVKVWKKNKKIILGVIIALVAIISLIAISSMGSDTTESSSNSDHAIGNDSQNSIFKEEFNSEPDLTYTMGPNLDYDYVEDHFVDENMEIKKENPEFAGSTIGAGVETKDYYAFASMLEGEYSGDIIYEKSTGEVKTITSRIKNFEANLMDTKRKILIGIIAAIAIIVAIFVIGNVSSELYMDGVAKEHYENGEFIARIPNMGTENALSIERQLNEVVVNNTTITYVDETPDYYVFVNDKLLDIIVDKATGEIRIY